MSKFREAAFLAASAFIGKEAEGYQANQLQEKPAITEKAGRTDVSDKRNKQERPANYYEGLPEDVAAEMKKVDAMKEEVKRALKKVNEKYQVLADEALYYKNAKKHPDKDAIKAANKEFNNAEKEFEDAYRTFRHSGYMIGQKYGKELTAIQSGALHAWSEENDIFANNNGGFHRSFKPADYEELLRKLKKFVK